KSEQDLLNLKYSKCEKFFARSSHLTRYFRICIGDKSFECNICMNIFTIHALLTTSLLTWERKLIRVGIANTHQKATMNVRKVGKAFLKNFLCSLMVTCNPNPERNPMCL
ncbi:hypothetical protein J0S82_009292, partial [Galemys pyrenaicus]